MTNQITSGARAVATAGTPVVLGASQRATSICVTALASNAGVIAAGGVEVVAATDETLVGVPLAAGASATFGQVTPSNLANVWLDATVDGDGVTFTFEVM